MIPRAQLELAARPLPSMAPTPLEEWLIVNADYEMQLAEKARLIEHHEADILQLGSGATAAVEEFGEVLIDALTLRGDFDVADSKIRRPDGRVVPRTSMSALHLASLTIQEDICILERQGDEHVLTAALLAFPASWTLAEKLGRPLTGIHQPVRPYDDGIAARVQRMFDALPPGRVLRRANALGYDDPTLYQPRSEYARREKPEGNPKWIRSERQTIRKLPRTGAVVFTILTSVAPYATCPKRRIDSTPFE